MSQPKGWIHRLKCWTESYLAPGKWTDFLQKTRIGHVQGRLDQKVCIASPQSPPNTHSLSDVDDRENVHTMSWSSLPHDMTELILAKLSTVELARISPVCSSFQALYRERMAVEQKSRLELAINLCGRERIAFLVALIAHLLLIRPLRRNFHGFYISADGVLRGREPPSVCNNCTIGRMDVLFDVYNNITTLAFFFSPGDACVGLLITFCCKGIIINVRPRHDEDLQPVAMVQAMLTGGLAQSLHQSGKWAEINIQPSSDNVTDAGLEAQITPLLPFASRYIPGHGQWVNYWEGSGECIRVGVAGSTRCSRMVSGLRAWAERLVRPVPQSTLLRHVVREGSVKCVLRGWTSLLTQLRGGRLNF